jgi:hypothetical protein
VRAPPPRGVLRSCSVGGHTDDLRVWPWVRVRPRTRRRLLGAVPVGAAERSAGGGRPCPYDGGTDEGRLSISARGGVLCGVGGGGTSGNSRASRVVSRGKGPSIMIALACTFTVPPPPSAPRVTSHCDDVFCYTPDPSRARHLAQSAADRESRPMFVLEGYRRNLSSALGPWGEASRRGFWSPVYYVSRHSAPSISGDDLPAPGPGVDVRVVDVVPPRCLVVSDPTSPGASGGA